MRKEIYESVQASLKKDDKERMSKDDFDELVKEKMDKLQEKYRTKALNLFKVEIPESETGVKLM